MNQAHSSLSRSLGPCGNAETCIKQHRVGGGQREKADLEVVKKIPLKETSL